MTKLTCRLPRSATPKDVEVTLKAAYPCFRTKALAALDAAYNRILDLLDIMDEHRIAFGVVG